MKRLLAGILTVLMLFMLGTAFAESDDYVLTIEGGTAEAHLEPADGEECLKVEVRISGVSAEKKLSALSFELAYSTRELIAVKCETASAVPGALANIDNAGSVDFAFASADGVTIADGTCILTLWFKLGGGLDAGTEIAFVLHESEAESYVGGTAAARTVGSAFTPFVLENATPIKQIDSAVIEWNGSDVKYKGTTPYIVYRKRAETPRFTVKDEDGSVIDALYYDYEFRENEQPGTAYLFVTFRNGYEGESRAWFKIYLPATASTAVENVANGVKISWAQVDGAAGYVIYRRAWSSTTNGWTTFERWNNTTDTAWIDTSVYAGTRYQYGVKAYFASRTDPVSGATIGGNVGDNYNLGEVGPLKTTVRITTRTLNSVTGGSKRLTVKWAGSKVFTGYQVQIATDVAFTKNVQTVKITKASTYETTIKSLKAKTIYYVRVRSYQDFEGMTYYGQWSNVKSAKTK